MQEEDMDNNNLDVAEQPVETISLRKSVLIYIGALFLLMVSMKVIAMMQLTGGNTLLMLLVVYLAIGVMLNRVVLRRLVSWHPMYNTAHNVGVAKLSSVILWPLSYAWMFLMLAVNKLL